MAKHWRVEVCVPRCDRKERIDGEQQHEQLGYKGEVVVHKPTLLTRVQSGPGAFIDQPPIQGCFEDVLAAEEEERNKL